MQTDYKMVEGDTLVGTGPSSGDKTSISLRSLFGILSSRLLAVRHILICRGDTCKDFLNDKDPALCMH